MAAALRRLDEEVPWYRDLPAEDRSYVGLVAQSGITAFVTWYADPQAPPHGVSEIFAAAPPELTRSISLQNTLQLVRIVVEVVEAHSDRLAAPGGERDPVADLALVGLRRVGPAAVQGPVVVHEIGAGVTEPAGVPLPRAGAQVQRQR